MSLVRVDLFLFSKARDAAFLSKADAAMQPKTVGFIALWIKGIHEFSNMRHDRQNKEIKPKATVKFKWQNNAVEPDGWFFFGSGPR